VIAQPETSLRRLKLSKTADLWTEPQPVILLYPPSNQVKEKFGISWFIPAIKRHKRVLIEVLIASLLVVATHNTKRSGPQSSRF
jgi:ATP-binding cassette, subfamily B, bacterial HlyB/CyaB